MNWEQQTSLSQFAENRSDFAEDLEDDAAIAETHEYDENLENHAAIQMKSVCHAVTSGVDEIRQRQYDATACGIEPIDSLKIRPRKEFVADNIPMCLTCWPEHITPDETLSPKYRGLYDRI